MSATNLITQETRPPSEPSKDYLLLQVENVALSGRLLAIQIFEVQNTALLKAIERPSSPFRSPPQPSTASSSSLGSARSTGFRVAAHDDLENEYSLFVTQQKAEYLYRAAYSEEAGANAMISSEEMANGILAHLNIIGSRQRDVGKLVCREPEPHVEKKTRMLPISTPPHKQKNPHLPSKRQDQRAVRVQKTSKRAMEEVAQAMRRPDLNWSGDDVGDVDSGKNGRKSSEASLLHRMAVADSNTMWKAELETNYEESDHASLLPEDDTEGDINEAQYALPPGLSPVKRALPERKTKHKDLEERRQKGRQQRILVVQATPESPSSIVLNSIQAVLEETEQEGINSRRLSMNTHSIDKLIGRSRALSAPRSRVVVGNAYGLKNLHESETPEPEQFLRRRTMDTHRRVLSQDNWHDDIPGMGIEISDERRVLQTPPNRLDALLGTARRVLMVNAVGSSLQQITSSMKVLPENKPRRISTAPMLNLYSTPLGFDEIHSETVQQSPNLANDCSTSVQPEEQAPITKPLISDEDATGTKLKAINMRTSPRLRSKSVITGPNATPLAFSDTETQSVDAPPSLLPSPITRDLSALPQFLRPRSNSMGSERIVRLAPLPSPAKPEIQEFLTPGEPTTIFLMAFTVEDEITIDKEVLVSPLDPEIVLCALSGLTPGVDKDFSPDNSDECASSLLAVPDLISSPQCFEEVLRVEENAMLPVVDSNTCIAGEEDILTSESNEEISAVTEKDSSSPFTPRQECWEEPAPLAVMLSEVLDEETNDPVDDGTTQALPASDNKAGGLELYPLKHRSSEVVVTEMHSTEFQAAAEDLTVDGDDYKNQYSVAVSGDILQENVVVEEITGSIGKIQQQSERQDSDANIIPHATNGPNIGEEVFSPWTDASELHDQYFENDGKKQIDASDTDSVQLNSRIIAENMPLILSAGSRVETTGQEINGGDAVESIERGEISQTIVEEGIPLGEEEDGNIECGDSYPNLCAQKTVFNEIDQSEAGIVDLIGKDDLDKSIENVKIIDKAKVDVDVDSSDVLALDDTTLLPHQNSTRDTELTDADTTVTAEEMTQERDDCNEEVIQTVDQEATINIFNKLPSQTPFDIAEMDIEPNQNISSDRTDNVAARPDQAMITVSSPEHNKPSKKISRKKSLSPTKRTSLPINANQAKPALKVGDSRRKSTVVKVADTQMEILSSSNLDRRYRVEDAKRRSRRTSFLEQSEHLPGLNPSTTGKSVKASVEKEPNEFLHPQSKRSSQRKPSHSSGSSQNTTNYHKKWVKWVAGRNLIEKVGSLQLEDLVIANPRDEENLLKLGIRYAKSPGTSLAGILMLEHAVLLQKTPSGTQDYWFWLGSAHLDIFMRHRKYLPVARFHLNKSIWAFTSAFAYMESLADPMRLLRYAICLFWHKGDENLEKTRDIFYELFSRFVHFCEKDLANLLFLQFQVYHRLKHYVDAMDCMNKILNLHEKLPVSSLESTNVVIIYDAADYRLMLMQCQQASGDYVLAAQSLATVVKLKRLQQDTTLRDEEYFDLWCSLAEKCFQHEDYALALEYYAVALNFAKQSQVLATIHYNLGLCFQSLGEDNKCVTEYKRARTANRHVPPLISLTELSISYEDRFALQLQKPVPQIVDDVRVELYGRAAKRLQHFFRRSRINLNVDAGTNNSDSASTKMPTLSKRRSSVVAGRNSRALVRIDDSAEEMDADEAENLQKPVVVSDNQASRLENDAFDSVERRHELFVARKQVAMHEMAKLLTNPQHRDRETSPKSHSKSRVKVDTQLRSGMLSPEKDRLDIRRKQSMEVFRQLGYVSSTMPWIKFWEKLLALAPNVYESRQSLYGSITRIRGNLPLVSDEVAFCALAESIGNVPKATEKLHDASYERELTYVCAVIDVSTHLKRNFPLETQVAVKTPRVLLPTIPSPRVDNSPNLLGETLRCVIFPPYSPAHGISSSTSKTPKHLRVNDMLNLHFQEHIQQQEAAIAITEATGGFAQPQRRMEKLKVLTHFRQTNDILVRSQLAFGSEKAAS